MKILTQFLFGLEKYYTWFLKEEITLMLINTVTSERKGKWENNYSNPPQLHFCFVLCKEISSMTMKY